MPAAIAVACLTLLLAGCASRPCQAPGPGLTLIGTIPASGGQLDFSKSANSALIAAVH